MKWNVVTQGITSGATYDASVLDYYEDLLKQYERAKRLRDVYEKQKREYERLRKERKEKEAKLERDRQARLEKLRKETSVEEREKAAVRALEKWGNGETPDQRDIDLFEISDYKKILTDNKDEDAAWYDKAIRKVKDFFLSDDGITATGWKTNDILASLFSGNIAKSREDLVLLNMAEDYFKGNKNLENTRAVQELNRRKPGFFNSVAVYANKALDWIGNNSVTGTTGAFLGTDELDKVRINIDFDENTESQQALLNIEALRNSYKAFDEESYNAYLENYNKARYYENMLSSEQKRKIDIAEGRIANKYGIVDGSVEFFNFPKLKYLLPGIIAGSISSPSLFVGSFVTGIATAIGTAATAAASYAAVVGTGGAATPLVLGALTGTGAGATFGLNLALGAHENAAEVDEGYVSKIKYALEQHPGIAASFYEDGRDLLGKGATDELIIVAKLANKIPSYNTIVDKIFDDAAAGSLRQYDRDMVATTMDSTVDTALLITPFKFFSTVGKAALKSNLGASRIARAVDKVGEKLSKLNGGDEGALRKVFGKFGATVSGKWAGIGYGTGAVLDNTLGRIPKVNTAIKAMAQMDISKIKRLGPKNSLWLGFGGNLLGRGIKSSISEGIEEGKQYYNQQLAVQEFQEGLKNGNLNYETQTMLEDVLDDFQAGDFAASGLILAITGIPLMDTMHYTDTNIIEAAEAIKNIKSGMIGGHGQTTAMTLATGLKQAVGTHGAIDDLELAIRALENNKLTAQKQFAQDQVLSKTNRKYIVNAIDYLKNSDSTKLSDEELENLQKRAIEVKGISDNKEVKNLAKRLGIAKDDYHAFVADYMYHLDNIEAEREVLRNAETALNAKANEIFAESGKIVNPSDEITEKWSKNDIDNSRRHFETSKDAQVKRLQAHLQLLNDKLEKEPLNNSQRANLKKEISSVEESLKKAEEAKFDDSKKVSYALARFDRINTLARIRGAVKLLSFLLGILSSMGEENTKGKEYVQKEIDSTKKLLNSWLVGNKLKGKQLTADNLDDIQKWSYEIATDIERGDKDNMFLQGPSAELSGQIESLAQAYQEYHKASLNYNISKDLLTKFIGYYTNDKGDIVEEGTEGAKYVKGNAKEHLEGIMAAQDDDAKLEQAYKKGFAEYGFAGVYKDDSPLVEDQNRQEEEEKPGTAERRQTIKKLGSKIRNFALRAKNYISGTWENLGNKKIFIPDEPEDRSELDPSENQMDAEEYFGKIVMDFKDADNVEAWLDGLAIDTDGVSTLKSNAHLLTSAYIETLDVADGVEFLFGDQDDRIVDVTYNGVEIGTITPVARHNKANGDSINDIELVPDGFDLRRINDDAYLESLIKPKPEPEPEEPGVSFSGQQDVSTPENLTDQQEAKINVLKDLAEKMNNKFDSTLRTSSHYFEWVGTGENRKLKLWHRLHDEIGSNFTVESQDKKNWSDQIKKLYSIVYHNGYSEDNPEGSRDIQALLNHLLDFYNNPLSNERLLERIEGYILYLKQEGEDISNSDLYECIKGISEEIAQETNYKGKNVSLDRGSAMDVLCRIILGTVFETPEKALEYCKIARMTTKSGIDILVKDLFTEESFKDAVTHLWNARKVYVDVLGYTLWTAPFTIYTEDYTNEDGSNINIAGEIDMLAIDKDGRPIIIDFKTSKYPFFDENGKLSSSFTTVGEKATKSSQEQYINQQSAYIEMLNETTRKETTFAGGFKCNEARLLPIRLISNPRKSDIIGTVDIQFSKDQLLVLQTIPFKQLGEKEGLIFDKESYRKKLDELSRLYAKVKYIVDRLAIYYANDKNRQMLDQMNGIKDDLDSIYLSLLEITASDLQEYGDKLDNAIQFMQDAYFGHKTEIDELCKKYHPGELDNLDEADRASSFNNLNWDNPLNENDIESLGGFKAMGVKDREEYDKMVEELAHVACNGDFKTNSSAKLTAIQYKTRRGNDKIAVYAAITYNGKTYPPIRLYLSKKNGEQFAKDVLDGKNVSANIMTTVGLLSKCSDGNQHSIAESKQLVNAIGGTEENPYENFMVDASSNMNVAVVTFNKTTGVLSTVSGDPQNDVEVVLPKTLKTSRANGHVVINVFPENSNLGKPIPIICNTPLINESLGKDKSNYKNQSLLEFLVDTVLLLIDSVEVGDPLEQYLEIDGEEIPLKLGQILNFFFEPHDPNNSNLIERPQYAIMAPSGGSEHRRIYIGNFAKEGGIKSISLDDTEALKDAIRQLSIWISTEMASVKWNSSKPGSEQFNKFAEFLSKLEDGERFYLGNTNIYFDKLDADGTFLGFLAKNGLLTTPFNGFSHPLISIDDCQEDDGDISPAVLDNDNNPFDDSIGPEEPEEGTGPTGPEAFASEDGEEEGSMFSEFAGLANQLDPEADYHRPSLEKLQSKRSRLDETAARLYIEKVLGKSFSNLLFVDEISSAIIGALSAGTFIAGQVTANMMKLSHYALNGTEYHEAFHWAFELIIDPKASNRVRAAVRKRYGIRGEREIAEWLADAYMHYVRNIYTPNGNIIQRAFGKIKLWGITFSHMFTCEYLIYKVFNSIHNGKFANKPINNEAVLKFLERLKELNSKNPSGSYEKDGIKYKFLQGPTDHEKSIEEVAFLVLNKVLHSPAVYYVLNKSFVVNVKAIHNINFARQLMMLPHKENGEDKKGYTTEQILKARNNPKYQQYYSLFDKALALRELVDDEHIEKTQEYVSAYIDRILGLKGKDLSVHGEDDGSQETRMDPTYADSEAGQNYSSYAGSPAEHIIPDHLISRMSKTSSRVKLFFATIPMMENTSENHNRFRVNRYGKFGYYELREVYQTILNRYHHVLSREALWRAIESDSKSNPMAFSLWKRISAIKKLASEGNDNAIGLLNEIYKNLKSTKQSHEVQKTRRVPGESWVTYKSVNIMVLNNSYAISREFTDTVLGGFNKFYEIVPYKNGKGEKVYGIKVRSKIQDELSNDVYPSSYRDAAYEAFFGSGYKNILTIVEEIDPNDRTKRIQKKNSQKIVHSIYDVLYSYGTSDQKPLYVYQKNKGGYVEVSIENSLPYIKLLLIEALSSIGVDITEEQLDDILETQFGGIGISQLKQLLIQKFTLPAKGNVHAAGASVTLRSAADNLYTLIRSEEDLGFVPGVIGVREEEYRGNIKSINGKDVFRNKQIHLLMSTLIATAQQEKYEVSARGVDGKLSYAMSDDNTVTAMCDVVFDKTGDPQCTAIRDMIINDPFNMSNGVEQFGNIPIGSYILPQVLSLKGKNIGYQIVNDAGIETGNRENSSTNSDKRGADTIMSTISKLCQNMIVLAPFADKSTALGIRLNGIRIPGLDYSKTTYAFKDDERTDEDPSQRGNTPLRQFINSVQAITVDDTGKVLLNKKDNMLDLTIALYVLAEYYQAKKAIQDYEDILRNGADGVAKNKTAFNICKKLMFMSQFSGDYVQVQNDKTKQWRWVFKPFGVEKGSNKTDLEAAKEMISQFESIVNNYDTLLSFVNRHINGLMQHELEKLEENGIIKKTKHSKQLFIRNQLLDNNIITAIGSGVRRRNREDSISESRHVVHLKAVRIFMYDIVGKAIISKQESERLFTGQSDLYEIVRDKETRIITVPYQDQAKRIGSFASTGTVGAVEREDYVCAEIADDLQSIEDLVVRSVYMNEIAYYQSTGGIDMSKHPGFDFRSATSQLLRDLVPEEYQVLIDKKIENVMKGFVLTKKDGSENKNNVTDGAAFISAKFTKQLLKQQGAWNHEIAKAFDRLTSDKPLDVNLILNDYKTFNDVWTQVIGMYKYTAVGFRTEIVNGHKKVVPYVNKYALAPVFACMCNDKMDAIRKQMESLNVDVLMFESAVKVGAHGNSDFTVDNNGNVTGKFNTYSQKTFFLRKQLNTDPNEKELLKIGIQTVKVALSAAIGEKNINWRGEVLDGDEIIDRIMKDIDNLTTKRYEKLTGKLDTPEHIVDYVVNFLRGNNVPEPIIEEFKNGVPAEALGIQKHIDTLSAKRTQEDIVRINAPGSAFIQRCVYGVEGPNVKFGSLELNDGEELKVVNSDGSMDCVLSMDYYVEFKHGIPYFKLTPKGQKKIKLTVTDKETGKERAMSFEEIRKWLKDNNIIGKNSKPSILSYRIPTQAVASINALKCVDIIPVVRDTVVLPKLFTTITGADFDIDKLFMSTVWYSMEEQEDGSYKVSLLQDDTTEEGLSNTVVNDYIDILCQTAINHPEIFYMSIDQDTKLADDVIAWIKEKYPPTDQEKLDSSSGILSAMPSMQAKVHDEFLAGRLGIGPFALALVNHVLTRIYKVAFNPQGIYLLNKSLARDEDDYGKSIMSWLSAMINKHVDVAKNPDITYLNVNDSTFNVVALLLRLGYGRRTFMFTCQDIMRDYAFAINQEEAVCKYTKNDNGYDDYRQNAYNKIIEKYKLDSVIDKFSKVPKSDLYRAACQEIFDRNINGVPLCEYILANGGKVPTKMDAKGKEVPSITITIGKDTYELTDKIFQFLNLQLFNYLSDVMAKPLTALQQATVIDNERCITSMIQSEFYKQSVAEVMEGNTFDKKAIHNLFNNSYISGKINKVTKVMDTIYDACSCMDKDVVTTVAKSIDPNILMYGKDRMQTFLSSIRDGMVAYYGAKFFDNYCQRNNINKKELFKQGSKGIVGRLAEIQASARSNRGKYKSLRNNLLIRGLSIDAIIGEEYIEDPEKILYNEHRFNGYEFLKFKYAGQSDDNMLGDVQLAWDELLAYPDEKILKFARDLVVYAFYTSGEMSGATKLFKYVPPSWRVYYSRDGLESGGYADYFTQVKEDKKNQYENIDDIIDKLCRNLWCKDKFVRTMNISTLLRFEGSDTLKNNKKTISSGEMSEGEDSRDVPNPVFSPVIAGIQYGKNGVSFIFRGGKDKCPRYLKCVDIHHDSRFTTTDDDAGAWVLYKLVGFNKYIDEQGNDYDYPVYVLTSALGEKYYRSNVFEFNDMLEENHNLDAYEMTKLFIKNLGIYKQKIGADDVSEAFNNVVSVLQAVTMGVNMELYFQADKIAEETMDIFIDNSTGKTTFQPLKTKDEFVAAKNKSMEKRLDKICNRP